VLEGSFFYISVPAEAVI